MFPFACKQNVNLRPIEQIRFPRKGNTLFTKNLVFENYVEFCRQNDANSQAVFHIPYKISRTQHSRQRRRARPSVPSAAAPRPEADCGAAAVCVNGSGRRALLFILRFSNLSPLKARIFTLLSLLICARLRAAAHCKTTAPHGASPVRHCKRVPGGRRGFCWLGSASVSGAPTTRRANAADGARESALDKPSRLLYTHTSK